MAFQYPLKMFICLCWDLIFLDLQLPSWLGEATVNSRVSQINQIRSGLQKQAGGCQGLSKIGQLRNQEVF